MKIITSHQLWLVTWNMRDAIHVLYCRFVAHESVVSQPVTYDFLSQESRPAGSPLVTPNSGHRRCDVLRVADLANGEAANPDSYLIRRLESPISSARHEPGPAYCKWRATTNARPCCSQLHRILWCILCQWRSEIRWINCLIMTSISLMAYGWAPQ